MKTLIILLLILFSYFWFYFASKYIIEFYPNNFNNANSNIAIYIFLFGLFIWGFLLGKNLSKECKKEKSEQKDEFFENNNYTLSKKSSKDNLKIIEGIGPKIEELLNKYGIYTFKDLEEADISRLTEILNKGGKRFMLHTPDTWSYQAKLALEGKIDELKEFQADNFKK